MSYIINPALWSRAFPVPAEITDKHIKLCSGVALKSLLLLLRSPDEFCDIERLAQKLGQPKAEIADALNYWEEQGILCQARNGQALCFNSPDSAASEPEPPPPAAAAAKAAPPPSRPRFPRDEALAIIEKDDTLGSLIQELQTVLGKPLTSADTDILVALYSFYGLSAHYILSLIHYCISIGRAGLAYAEKVAVSWINDGVGDGELDAHIDMLHRRRSNEGLVRSAFGIHNRNLTTREKDYIASWFNMGFDISMIQYAFEVTVDRTGKVAFGYINRILQSWSQSGIKTVEQAKAEPAPQKTSGNTKVKKSDDSANDRDRMILEQFLKG